MPTPLRAAGFLEAWDRLVEGEGVPTVPRRRGRKPRVPLDQLLPTLTFHVMQGTGTLAEHLRELFDTALANSSWSDRRTRLPWAIFADLMRRALRPRATRRQHPEAFWNGWRLLALDGTQFSLTNTPQITARTQRKPTGRGHAAFAKLTTNVLLELGWHNPVAAAIGRPDDSEWALAQRVITQLPPRALVLGDRLYGVTAFLRHVQPICRRVGSHFLFRVRSSIQARTVKRWADGSRQVRVALRDAQHGYRVTGWLVVREIRVQVGRRGYRPHDLRLWTSVRPRTGPALDLAQLYAQRWEHELYFRELKRDVRHSAVLQSHTVDTAAQEVAALVLATAVLASERARAAAGCAPVLRVRFGKVLQIVRSMWLMLGPFHDLITSRQQDQIVRRGYTLMRQCLTAPRRPRTCPRAARQPARAWPRLAHAHSITGPLEFHVV